MKSLGNTIYSFFITFPDRLYPFATKVGNRRVRGRKSYELARARAAKIYGLGRYGYKLTLYRELFHFAGSILFIVVATLLSKQLFGSDVALYVLCFVAIVALAYQEFVSQPKHFGQHPGKGILDWLTWVTPILIYLFH